MTRRNALTAALAAPFAKAAAGAIAPLKRKSAPAPAAAPLKLAARPITQAELQSVIDSWNRMELLAGDIRRRLESGAGMERGRLGVSTWGSESLQWYIENGSDGKLTSVSEVAGLEIAPVEELERDAQWVAEYPQDGGYVVR